MLNAFSKIRRKITITTVIAVVVAIALIMLGIASRTILSRNYAYPWIPILGNNFEIVTVVGVVAGLLFGIRFGWIVPLTIMAGSDLFLGNDSNIVVFTWTGFVIPAVVGGLVRQIVSSKKAGSFGRTGGVAVGGFGGSLLSVLFFFGWSNFGVWLFWYPKTVEGLVRCYTLAVPFLANQLKANLLVGGLVFGGYLLCVVLWKFLQPYRGALLVDVAKKY